MKGKEKRYQELNKNRTLWNKAMQKEENSNDNKLRGSDIILCFFISFVRTN